MLNSLVRIAYRSSIGACFALVASASFAGDSDVFSRGFVLAPLAIPNATELDLDWRSRRRSRRPSNTEVRDRLDMTPGLQPFEWPRNTDMRARLLTPELRGTPVFGWIAENLYRSRSENGWCLEVDPGEGEYVVLYRLHLK